MTEDERRAMWLNFLNRCLLTTVVQAADTTVWQKRGNYEWIRMGASGDYSPESIACPVDVLLGGLA